MPVPAIEERHVLALEAVMDELSTALEPLQNFVLPGGPLALHSCMWRALFAGEPSDIWSLSQPEPVGTFTVRYLNRLSDALFVMARYENAKKGVADVLWDSRA